MDHQLVGRRKTVERERARFEQDPSSPALDPILVDSWLRCGGGTSGHAPTPVDVALDRWDSSLIRRHAPGIVPDLQTIADDVGLMATITDEKGCVLWAYGGRDLRDRCGWVDGALGSWVDESTLGTNAAGLALITGRPSSVFAAEHWYDDMQDLVCYAAPVHDAAGGQVGTIDFSSPWDQANPLALPTLTSLARLVELQIPAGGNGRRGRWRAPNPASRDGGGYFVEPTPRLELDVLGRGAVRVDGKPVLLTPRQVEVVTILACTGGATLDELHTHLHGDRSVSLTTTKVEVSRVRAALGSGVVGSRPYRLRVPVAVDLLRLLEHLQAGDLGAAMALYGGQVLPRSDAPFIEERRHHCDVALRTAVLEHGTPAQLLAFANVHRYDVAVTEAAVARSRNGDPLRASATAALSIALGEPGQF